MGDLNIQGPSFRPQPDRRPEPRRDVDRDRFSKQVEKRDNREDEEEIDALPSTDDESSSIFALSRSKGKKGRSSQSTGQSKSDISGVRIDDEAAMGDTDENGRNKQGGGGGGNEFGQGSREGLFQYTQTALQAANFSEKAAASSLSKQDTFELVKQMIEKITEIKKQGQTATEIVFKHPPLFEGASVTITEFNSAKGEFNLTFQNLSAQAKQMIDLKTSQDSLKETLQEKGYNVHIIVATTETEKSEFREEAQPQKDQQQKGDDGQQGQKQKDKEQ